MKRAFLSYRRADSSDVTGRIYDHLKERFGDECLFKDVHSIPLGGDFRSEISKAITDCDVLLVVIGDDWLNAADSKGQLRLEQPDDYVRNEI